MQLLNYVQLNYLNAAAIFLVLNGNMQLCLMELFNCVEENYLIKFNRLFVLFCLFMELCNDVIHK